MNKQLEEFYKTKQYEQKYRLLFDYFCSEKCLCLSNYEDEDFDEQDWEDIEEYMNNAILCISKGFSEEWTKQFVGGMEDSFDENQYVSLTALKFAYAASKCAEEDLKKYCQLFTEPNFASQRIKYYINNQYCRPINEDGFEWVEIFKDDIKLRNSLLQKGKNEDYILFYINHSDFWDDEMADLRAGTYDSALRRGLDRELSESLARVDIDTAFRKCLSKDFPEEWQQKAIAAIFGRQISRGQSVDDEDELSDIFVDLFLSNPLEDNIEFIVTRTYDKYYAKHPSEQKY